MCGLSFLVDWDSLKATDPTVYEKHTIIGRSLTALATKEMADVRAWVVLYLQRHVYRRFLKHFLVELKTVTDRNQSKRRRSN